MFNEKEKIRRRLEEDFGKPVEKERNIDLIRLYFDLKEKNENIVDGRTWDDLDMEEVFSFVDRTLTTTGEQILYDLLRNNCPVDETRKFDVKVKYYLREQNCRLDNSVALNRYSDSGSYNLPGILFNGVTSGIPKYVWVLSILSLLLMILTIANASFFIPFLVVGIVNTSLHYYFKKNINVHTLDFKNLKALDICFNKLVENDNEKEVLSGKEKRILNSISKKSLFLSINIDVSNELSALLFYVIEIVKGFFLADAIQFNRIISLINREKELIKRVFEFTGRVDAAISVASLKSGGIVYSEPLFVKDKKFDIVDLYHPLIKDCKRNGITIKDKNVVITGGNMSGKTTFLKTVGINVLLARTINFTFSSKFELPYLRIFSSIHNEDRLSEGVSFFMDELLRTKEVIESLSSSAGIILILIDEIYRGTNSKDRITLASSVLNFLAGKNCMVLVTTHDPDIIKFVKPNFEPFYFDNSFKDNKVVFDYKIHKGIQLKTNVVQLIKSLDFPEEIVNTTVEYGEKFESRLK